MASTSTQTAHPLTNTIHREEKRYLICAWASQLVQLIEKGEALDERSIQSLHIARSYADAALGARIDRLLHSDDELFGDEDEDLEYEDDEPAPASDLFGREDDAEDQLPESSSKRRGRSELSQRQPDPPAPGFVPTADGEREETPGFVPSKGERKESKIGKRVQDDELFAEEEDDVSALDAGDTRQEDPFDAGDPMELFAEEPDAEETGDAVQGEEGNPAEPSEGEGEAELEAAAQSDDEPPAQVPDEDPAEKRKEQLKTQAEQTRKASAQRMLDRKKRAKERFEQRKKQREEGDAEGGEEAGEELLFSLEDQLAKLKYIVTVDRLEEKLGVQVIPEDRLRLERQLPKKLREAPIRSLLDRAEEQNLSLVMVPRLNRLIREGQLLKITGVNLLRTYPQFFENVQQVALKLRTEPHFLQESPSVTWAITTAEVLPSSRNTSYIQQKQILKQHAQSHQTNEMQVRRRTLIEALYDLIAAKVVTGTDLLSATADLTESSMGRQNMAFINVGENGIRISDIGRQQTHPQLGVCPNW